MTQLENGKPTLHLVVTAVLVMVALATLWSFFPLVRWLAGARDAVLGLGALGIVLFISVYAMGVVIFAPATPFTIMAGALYGLWGVPISLAGALAGAVASFGIARGSLRERWAFLCDHQRLTQAFERAVTALGWKAVLLVRLSPLVPFSLQNYLFGMTGVSVSAFVLAGLIGMVPATIVKASFGIAGTGGFVASNWPIAMLAVLGGGATMLAAVIFVRRMRAHAGDFTVRAVENRQDQKPSR